VLKPLFPFDVCQLTGLKKSSDRNPNRVRGVRAHQLLNSTVHRKESDAAWPRVPRACCSMESPACHSQEVFVFGCPGLHFKRTAERPRCPSGFDIIQSSPLYEHVYVAVVIKHIIPVMIVLGPGANSASDLCPSGSFQFCTRPPNQILPLLLIKTSRCSNIST
jgi:hypothetical protein